MSESPTLPDPLFAVCWNAYPERPDVDVAETPWTREQLAGRIDYWHRQIHRFHLWGVRGW